MSGAAPDPAGLVFDLQRWSTDDGPGIRTTVFFQGCPLRCAWCCNPEAWAAEPGGRDGLGPRRMTAAEILAEVLRDRVFYRRSGGGVTFSGGEATTQPELLRALVEGLGALGIGMALETCGHFPWEPMAPLLARMDLVHFDLKHMDEAAHLRLTGQSNRLILANARRLARLGVPWVVRIPLVPGCNDDAANLAATARFTADELGRPPVEVLPYHALGVDKYRRLGLPCPLADLVPPTPEVLDRAKDILAENGARVR